MQDAPVQEGGTVKRRVFEVQDTGVRPKSGNVDRQSRPAFRAAAVLLAVVLGSQWTVNLLRLARQVTWDALHVFTDTHP